MSDDFAPDPNIQKIAEAYALDAVDFAKDNLNTHLDWSDESVNKIESILAIFHDQIGQAEPPEEKILQFSKMFGSYVGEVYRKNHGATWGMVTLGDESFPGMKDERSGVKFWPWGRARNRIAQGPGDSIWDYYNYLLSETGDNSEDGVVGKARPQRKRPWWKLW